MPKGKNKIRSLQELKEQLKDEEARLKDLKERYENYEFFDEQLEEIEDIAKKYTKKIMFELTNIQVPQNSELLEKEQKLAEDIFEDSIAIVKFYHSNLLKDEIEICERGISVLEKNIELMAKEESD